MDGRKYRKMIQRFWTALACSSCLALIHLAGGSVARAQDAEFARKLSLKDAVNLAVANSRDIALARLQYGVMQRQIGVARSVFLPNIYTGTELRIQRLSSAGGWRSAGYFYSFLQSANFQSAAERRATRRRAACRGAASFDR